MGRKRKNPLVYQNDNTDPLLIDQLCDQLAETDIPDKLPQYSVDRLTAYFLKKMQEQSDKLQEPNEQCTN